MLSKSIVALLFISLPFFFNTTSKSDVVINGRNLSEKEVKTLTNQYGVQPLPGAYWYDATSGLYGVEGHQAFGFMLPGHAFGDLSRDASDGTTDVLINGRELPQSEWLIWSYMIGNPIAPGEYWLDERGNAGSAGNPRPQINLFALAKNNAYIGQGGSGDNFWSSRFSAGNYDSNNSRGYVSVPGYGPVGYGF
ncbi:MAG: hypothetical protein KTR29_15550 [Rhodothermaceae bacterium]|nr:hypothetical protein [Rhodothermaceae bacterium]